MFRVPSLSRLYRCPADCCDHVQDRVSVARRSVAFIHGGSCRMPLLTCQSCSRSLGSLLLGFIPNAERPTSLLLHVGRYCQFPQASSSTCSTRLSCVLQHLALRHTPSSLYAMDSELALLLPAAELVLSPFACPVAARPAPKPIGSVNVTLAALLLPVPAPVPQLLLLSALLFAAWWLSLLEVGCLRAPAAPLSSSSTG